MPSKPKVLEQILRRLTENPQPHEPATPSVRCPRCAVERPEPYGRAWWRDAYGSWHCAACNPPAAPGQVREQFLVEVRPDPVVSGPQAPAGWGGLWAILEAAGGTPGWERVLADGRPETAQAARWWHAEGLAWETETETENQQEERP